MRVMVDSDQEAWPDEGWDIIAAYINGTRTWDNYNAAKLRFPNSQILSITVNGDPTYIADICDCEEFDYTVTNCAQWVNNMINLGRRPTVYCSRSTRVAVVASLNSAYGIKVDQVDWWIATLDGTQEVDGAVAVQYLDDGAIDWSIVWDDAWHPSLVPIPPVPIPKEIDLSEFVAHTVDGVQYHVTVGNGKSKAIMIDTPDTGSALTDPPLSLPYPIHAVSDAYIAKLNS